MQNLEIYKLKNEIKALQLQLENQRRQYEEEINILNPSWPHFSASCLVRNLSAPA